MQMQAQSNTPVENISNYRLTDPQLDLLVDRIIRELLYHRLNREAAERVKYSRQQKREAAA